MRSTLIAAGTLLAAGCASRSSSSTPTDMGAGPACAAQPFAAACDPSATTQPPAGSFGSPGPHPVVVETLANPHPRAPGPVSVYRPGDSSHVPAIFFAHALGAGDPGAYDALFRRLAGNGLALIQVPYPDEPPVTQKNADRYDCLWQGFVAAPQRYGATFDLERVGFVGHAFGGGAAPELARRGFVDNGWGASGRFLFIMAPWYSWGRGYDTLPDDVRAVIEVYADDDEDDHQIAVQDIWNKLPAPLERGWLLIRTDVCQCGLNATHALPRTSGDAQSVLDGYDAWGVWRRLHALAAYAFTGDGAAHTVAYGIDDAMGAWSGCGGRGVRAIESGSTPITGECRPFRYLATARCAYADPGVTCP
jgi:hypothetical protein